MLHQTTPRTTEGTMISNLDEFAALRIAFATVLGLNDVGGILASSQMTDDQKISSNHNWTNHGNPNPSTL